MANHATIVINYLGVDTHVHIQMSAQKQTILRNQVHAGLQPARTWLKTLVAIVSCQSLLLNTVGPPLSQH